MYSFRAIKNGEGKKTKQYVKNKNISEISN